MSKNLVSVTWSSLTDTGNNPESIFKGPRARHKHAVCLHKGSVYLYGGKDGHRSLSDLWKYSIGKHFNLLDL